MADAKKKKRVYLTSPVGPAKFPHLTVPQTKIGTKTVEPTYGVSLVVDPSDEAVVAFKERVLAAHAAAYAEAKKKKRTLQDMGIVNMIRDEVKKDEEDNEIPTGKLELRFKCKAGGKRKDGTEWTFKPFIYDVNNRPLPAGTMVYGGSVIEVSFCFQHTAMETGAFYTKLDLQAVRVHVLKSQSDREAASFGFGSVPQQDGGDDTEYEESTTAGAPKEAPASGADF